MSLQLAAKHLAAKGRGPDTELVHMSMDELKSLQDLAKAHGGSLSINPDTGLPEAGFLDSVLPAVIGAGLAFATGGTSLALTPAMIGLGIGGVQTLRTGSLEKGLMAGLGAYGGAGLTAGLAGAAAASPEVVAQAIGTPAAATGPGSQAAMLASQNAGFGQPGLEALSQSAAGATKSAAVPSLASQAGSGISALSTEAGRQGFMQGVGGGTGLLKYGLAAAAPSLLEEPEYKAPELDREQYRYAYSPGRMTPPTRSGDAGEYTYFQPTFTRLAEGGGVMDRARRSILGDKPEQSDNQYKYTYDPAKQQYTKVVPPAVPLAALAASLPIVDTGGYGGGEMGSGPGLAGLSAAALGESHGDAALGAAQGYAAADAVGMSGFDSAGNFGADHGAGIDGSGMYAKGGNISHLGDYSDGGRLLRGPGDGVSDSIPAMIGRKQPARLADGEFVVPARIVSELGNGSTEAGARKLYAMMDRIQKARGKTVGKGKVAKNSRAEKYLPA